jgi:hypothetical protein
VTFGDRADVLSLDLLEWRPVSDRRLGLRGSWSLGSSCFLSFFGWSNESIENDGLLGGVLDVSMWLIVSLRWRALTTSLTVLGACRGEGDVPWMRDGMLDCSLNLTTMTPGAQANRRAGDFGQVGVAFFRSTSRGRCSLTRSL